MRRQLGFHGNYGPSIRAEEAPSAHCIELKAPQYKKELTTPILRLNMYVIGKLEYLLSISDVEVGGYLIAEDANEPMNVTDFILVKQQSGHASVVFDDDGVMDYYNDMFEKGLDGYQCVRIWAHTHPEMPATPSMVDERVFQEKFCNKDVPGCCQPWTIMFIRSKTGEASARLAFNPEHGPQVQVNIPVVVDPRLPFKASDPEAWKAEFEAKVSKATYSHGTVYDTRHGGGDYSNYSWHGKRYDDRRSDFERDTNRSNYQSFPDDEPGYSRLSDLTEADIAAINLSPSVLSETGRIIVPEDLTSRRRGRRDPEFDEWYRREQAKANNGFPCTDEDLLIEIVETEELDKGANEPETSIEADEAMIEAELTVAEIDEAAEAHVS